MACCYCPAVSSNNLTLPPTMKLLYRALSSHGTAVTKGEFVLPCWFIILASMSLASSSNFEFPFALHLYACPMDLGYWYLMKDTQVTELISPSVMIQRCISLTASTSILVDYNLSSVWSPDILHCFISRLFFPLEKKITSHCFYTVWVFIWIVVWGKKQYVHNTV